jgi:hypothetical protein
MPAGGKPGSLTPQVQTAVCKSLRAGNTRPVAALAAGIGYTTFRTWMRLGKSQGKGQYRTFRTRVRTSEAEALQKMLARVVKASSKSWHAAAWFLERKAPQDWSNNAKRIVQLEKQVAELVKLLASRSQPGKTGPPPDGPGATGAGGGPVPAVPG